ncbi:hydroxyethylthiazole kinase [Alsobacter sp. R-9]
MTLPELQPSPEASAGVLRAVRAERPLVHNITNFVVMNFTANVLLAAGASPAMVHAVEEVEEFVAFSRALVVNIGTLDAGFVAGMERAATAAAKAGVPWVLDPVGVGATGYRNRVAAGLLDRGPAVVRGNASEIIALAGVSGARPRGVDSAAGSEEALAAARSLSARSGAVVAITGATDYVVSGDDVSGITGGHPMSQDVTGTGCATTALVGACLAVAGPRDGAVAALSLMKAAATRAAAAAQGPGSFAVHLLDALHAISTEA